MVYELPELRLVGAAHEVLLGFGPKIRSDEYEPEEVPDYEETTLEQEW